MNSSLSPSSSLLVPLTFGHALGPKTRSDLHSGLLDVSYSRAQLSVIKSTLNTSSKADSAPSAQNSVIVGAVDGSLYLFSQARHSPSSESQISRPTSPPRPSRDTTTSSRSSTPSNTSPLPFNVNPRSQVVSGVTAELVEAPKNYVDFDDEPDKLKDMLKGRQPRDSRDKSNSSSETSRNLDRGTSPTPSLSSLPRHKQKEIPKALHPSTILSASKTSLSSPRSSFPPSNSTSENSPELDLWCHVVAPRSGPGRTVSSICLTENDKLFCVLQEHGDLSVISLEDGSCLATIQESEVVLQPPSGVEDKHPSHVLWLWNHLETYSIGQSTFVLASAAVNPEYPSPVFTDRDNDTLERTQISIYELHKNERLASLDVSLEKVGQWCLEGICHRVGLHEESDGVFNLFYVTEEGNFSVRGLHLLPHTRPRANSRATDKDTSITSAIPLANPFKALKPRSAEHLPLQDDVKVPGRIALDTERHLGNVLSGGPIVGFRTSSLDRTLLGIAWSEKELTLFECAAGRLRVLHNQILDSVQEACWTSDSSYTVLFQGRAECYVLDEVEAGNIQNDTNVLPENGTAVRPRLLRSIQTGRHEMADIGSASQILTCSRSDEGGRSLIAFPTPPTNRESSVLWQVDTSKRERSAKIEITSLLPLELDDIALGSSDGHLRQTSMMQLISQDEILTQVDQPALNGYLTGLHLIWNSRTKERFIAGGGDDGSIAFWTADHFKLCARWTLFITPLHRVIQIEEMEGGLLKGCVLCVAEDGTIAAVAIDGFQFLYMIPGSAAPLYRICVSADNVLLVYADNRARLWDLRTQEFWRSMTSEKVEELISQGGWTSFDLLVHQSFADVTLKPIVGARSVDVGSTLLLDVGKFATASVTVAKSISTNRDQTRAILLTLERLRSVLSVLLTPGLNEDIDSICSDKLGIQHSVASVGFLSKTAITLYRNKQSHQQWCLSCDASAARALAIAVVLGALSLFEEFMEAVNTVTIFYATSLATAVGPSYKAPSLVYLARRWFDGSTEVRRSARVLFDYSLAYLSDDEANETVEYWQHHLPCLQPAADRESAQAALALFLCGYLASEKYSLLSVNALTDISKSIALYLHDERSLHRVLAVDLCSRGFHIWQHYIDAMEILRALFNLATTSRKDSINLQNTGAQARLAVLQIASSNTALFMTTLGLDILTPPTLEHRKSVMQIVAFLIRKRPLVLQPNVPKLMEAVVKSLDPNATMHREAVLDSATEIIGYVVKTFPTVDFHMTTQRLAVGSGDGAVVMYDVKTAIRLYVLERHKKPISACSFSPDGRRLLTLSLEESLILVWKVGTSFTSFFNPGAPPRQGHSGSEPFKTISFNVGSEAKMTMQETMELVRFNWVADRSVKIKIRESVLTFST